MIKKLITWEQIKNIIKPYIDGKTKLASSTTDGLMSSVDKAKLDGIEAGATAGGGGSCIGEITTGKTFTINGTSTTAAEGATILNNLNTNIATGKYSMAMGNSTVARGFGSVTMGYSTNANGSYSVATGYETTAGYCAFAMGINTIAKDFGLSIGKYCKTPTAANNTAVDGDLFVVGNGLTVSNSNAFRVTSEGNVYGTKAYTASGADICHAIEWLDGNPNNEDRRGLFVTLDGDKIRLANTQDTYILGVISANPSLICNAATDDWSKKWETDIFGERVLDKNKAWILNKDFREEDNENYVSRLDRKEWATVGHCGILIAVDDGTCEVNSYCMPNDNGVATAAETGYRVMKRLDETHIEIFVSAPVIVRK